MTRTARLPVHRVTIVGTGTIGASWATHYLARGFDVAATDPASGAEKALRSYVDDAWETATAIGLAPGASPDRLSFTPDLRRAAAEADFILRVHRQEAGPPAQGTARSCRQPAAGRAVPRGCLPDRPGRAGRRRG